MSFVGRVRRTLERRRLLSQGRRVVVACSGGPDSAALLQALAELSPAFGLELTAASVDHGLRPEAADEIALVRAHAARLGVAFRQLRVHVGGSRGKQAGARAARYAALKSVADDVLASQIATGHTLDDQAETIVGRLLRNPSVRSLSGVRPAREDGVIRPLIDCRRSEVMRFVAQRGLEVAEDPSNRDPAYARVRVRHGLLPALLAENPKLVEALGYLAEDAQAHDALVRQCAERAAVDLAAPGASVVLAEQPAPVRRWILSRWIERETGTPPSLDQLRQLDGGQAPEGVLLAAGRVARLASDGSFRLCVEAKRTRGS